MLTTLTISEFTAKLASKDPAPGGGSAAALSGLLGASLAEMAVGLTRGRKEFAAHEELLANRHADLSRLRVELQLLVDRDAAAFSAVMAAYGLPKASEEDKQTRSAAIQTAMREAAEVPLLTARLCLAVLEAAGEVADKINPHALSDLMVGALASHTGLTGALLNTAINLPALKDQELVEAYQAQVRHLRVAADERIAAVKHKVYSDPTFAAMRG